MIRNGLYLVTVSLLDGADDQTGEKNSIAVLHDGTMLGGGPYYYYFGTYTSANGRWRGEATNQEHTTPPATLPFARKVVTIGFSGTYTDEGAEVENTGLFGKRSRRFKSTFRLLKADWS
jgi:hypothetical protein